MGIQAPKSALLHLRFKTRAFEVSFGDFVGIIGADQPAVKDFPASKPVAAEAEEALPKTSAG
jgi:hypothetical protein